MSQQQIPISIESESDNIKVKWDRQQEDILKGWADKAASFKWMHDKAYKKYNCQYAWITIPIIVLSTVAGTANFSHDSFGQEWTKIANKVIGGVNILVSIITAVSQFLKIANRVAGHEVASTTWDKYSRNIKVELSKKRRDRIDVKTMLKIYKEEYDRLVEISPNIPTDVISKFNRLITSNKHHRLKSTSGCLSCLNECCCFPFGCECRPLFKRKIKRDCENIDIEIPEICGIIKPTFVTREDGYSPKKQRSNYDSNMLRIYGTLPNINNDVRNIDNEVDIKATNIDDTYDIHLDIDAINTNINS